MASPLPSGDPPLSVATQAGHLSRRYGIEPRHRDDRRLVWVARLTPSEYSDTYEVLVDHQMGKTPLVYVPRPQLELAVGEEALPHVYRLNTLCLFFGKQQWDPSVPIADTLVPWACEWLHFYELWLVDGDWHGEGKHPDLEESSWTRRERRAVGREADSRAKRLRSALRYAYGRDVDLSALLYNSRLGRTAAGNNSASAA